MRAIRLVLEGGDAGIALDVTCRGTTVPYEDPVEVTRVDGRLVGERITYELTGTCAGWVEVGGERHLLDPATSSFFRNHSWGVQAGRGGPRLYAAPTVGARRRVPGRAAVGALPHARSRRVLLHRSERSCRVGQGCADARRPHGRGRRRRDRTGLLRGRSAAALGHASTSPMTPARAAATPRSISAGSTARAAAISADTTTVSGKGCTAATCTSRVRRGTSRTRPRWSTRQGRRFEFDHAWAENFTRLTSDGQTGLAHYECVVIQRGAGLVDRPRPHGRQVSR